MWRVNHLPPGGPQLAGMPSAYSGRSVHQLKEDLLARNIDWVKTSKIRKADLAALLLRLDAGGFSCHCLISLVTVLIPECWVPKAQVIALPPEPVIAPSQVTEDGDATVQVNKSKGLGSDSEINAAETEFLEGSTNVENKLLISSWGLPDAVVEAYKTKVSLVCRLGMLHVDADLGAHLTHY